MKRLERILTKIDQKLNWFKEHKKIGVLVLSFLSAINSILLSLFFLMGAALAWDLFFMGSSLSPIMIILLSFGCVGLFVFVFETIVGFVRLHLYEKIKK